MYKFPAKKRIRRSGKFKELSISATTALSTPEGSDARVFFIWQETVRSVVGYKLLSHPNFY